MYSKPIERTVSRALRIKDYCLFAKVEIAIVYNLLVRKVTNVMYASHPKSFHDLLDHADAHLLLRGGRLSSFLSSLFS
jgi:hypothetical protein